MSQPSTAENPIDGSDVRAEVQRLKKQIRTLGIVLTGLVVVTAAEFILSGGIPKRGALYSGKGGRVFASADSDSAGVTVRSRDRTLRALLGAKAESDVDLALYDTQGRPRIDIGVIGSDPVIRFFDENGRKRMEWALAGEACHIEMFDKDGQLAWSAP